MPRNKQRPQVVAIYCPLWHNYDHASSWKGEGWCEWELLKAAVPRFKGHRLPLKPSWGCFDESDPKWAAREIGLAADHGVDVFLFDWYWYNGVRLMEEALERGFLKAPNRRRLKFALMWANHDWADYFPPPFGKPWNSWLPSRHSAADTLRVIDYGIANYFRHPNYWIVDGRLYVSLFQPVKFVEELGGPSAARALLRRADARLRQAGLPPLHLNAMLWDPKPAALLRDAGFLSVTSYNIASSGKPDANLTERYEDLIATHQQRWDALSGQALPYDPVVTMGWDVTPRCEKNVPWPFPPSPLTGKRDYPYGAVVLGNTPARFEKLCRLALQQVERTSPNPRAVFFNAWNEWTEGSFLLPEKQHGSAYLQAIHRVFGRKR
jgi:hypothetical protein